MKASALLHMISEGTHRYFEEPEATELADRSAVLYRQYCREHADDPPALKEHTEGMIYAGAALYRALQEKGKSKEEALELTDRIFQDFSEAMAEKLRRLLKFPGLYRLIPWVFRTVMPKKYSRESGFAFRFYDVGKGRTKFDMTACPYDSVCRALGCPELTTVFCNTDDCCYGNMHPKLKWHRDGTIGRGDEVCDFDIGIEK